MATQQVVASEQVVSSELQTVCMHVVARPAGCAGHRPPVTVEHRLC